MSDRLRDALDAWMEGDDEIADIGVIVQAARKALAGPSPEAVQAATDAIWTVGVDEGILKAVGLQAVGFRREHLEAVATAALAAAWAHDFGPRPSLAIVTGTTDKDDPKSHYISFPSEVGPEDHIILLSDPLPDKDLTDC